VLERERKGGGTRATRSVARRDRFKDTSLSAVATSNKPVSTTLVFRIAKFAKVGVDDVLTGKFPEAGTCPHRGHRPSDVDS
jgi:hypothetical protein